MLGCSLIADGLKMREGREEMSVVSLEMGRGGPAKGFQGLSTSFLGFNLFFNTK